jgi:hypothetical protein
MNHPQGFIISSSPDVPPPLSLSTSTFRHHGNHPILKSSGVTPGERFSQGSVPGSRIHVNQERVERQVGACGAIPRDIGIHTEPSSGIPRKDFEK